MPMAFRAGRRLSLYLASRYATSSIRPFSNIFFVLLIILCLKVFLSISISKIGILGRTGLGGFN